MNFHDPMSNSYGKRLDFLCFFCGVKNLLKMLIEKYKAIFSEGWPVDSGGSQVFCPWKSKPGWWFQPIWQVLDKMHHFPQVGVKIKTSETTLAVVLAMDDSMFCLLSDDPFWSPTIITTKSPWVSAFSSTIFVTSSKKRVKLFQQDPQLTATNNNNNNNNNHNNHNHNHNDNDNDNHNDNDSHNDNHNIASEKLRVPPRAFPRHQVPKW